MSLSRWAGGSVSQWVGGSLGLSVSGWLCGSLCEWVALSVSLWVGGCVCLSGGGWLSPSLCAWVALSLSVGGWLCPSPWAGGSVCPWVVASLCQWAGVSVCLRVGGSVWLLVDAPVSVGGWVAWPLSCVGGAVSVGRSVAQVLSVGAWLCLCPCVDASVSWQVVAAVASVARAGSVGRRSAVIAHVVASAGGVVVGALRAAPAPVADVVSVAGVRVVAPPPPSQPGRCT